MIRMPILVFTGIYNVILRKGMDTVFESILRLNVFTGYFVEKNSSFNMSTEFFVAVISDLNSRVPNIVLLYFSCY